MGSVIKGSYTCKKTLAGRAFCYQKCKWECAGRLKGSNATLLRVRCPNVKRLTKGRRALVTPKNLQVSCQCVINGVGRRKLVLKILYASIIIINTFSKRDEISLPFPSYTAVSPFFYSCFAPLFRPFLPLFTLN